MSSSGELKNAKRRAQNALLEQLWAQFDALFTTDEDCWRELYKNADGNVSIKCRFCSKIERQISYTSRVIRCSDCHEKTWFTSGTFFDRIRHVKAWLGAIWLMERGMILSSSRFHKLAGIAQSSALHILTKLRMVIQNNNIEEGGLSVPSLVFHPSVCKRSRETPARAHPQAEEEVFESSNYEESCESGPAHSTPESSLQPNIECVASALKDQADLSATGYSMVNSLIGELTDRQREILVNILDEPVSFDQLAWITGSAAGELSTALTYLELAGLISRLNGDRFVRTHSQPQRQSRVVQLGDSTLQNESETVVTAICSFLGLHFHGISRKYLQPYIAAFWCHHDRTRWCCDALKEACLRSSPISYEQILEYVTPSVVQLFALP